MYFNLNISVLMVIRVLSNYLSVHYHQTQVKYLHIAHTSPQNINKIIFHVYLQQFFRQFQIMLQGDSHQFFKQIQMILHVYSHQFFRQFQIMLQGDSHQFFKQIQMILHVYSHQFFRQFHIILHVDSHQFFRQ